ncbi:MAG: PaaI family thioesterase [Actinomycetota bacterium]|nr:PaaI family thioesterase [Actinomycetota bacterium]
MTSVGAFLSAHGAEWTLMTGTRVEGRLLASADHHTPWGVVHGGVYCTAIESAASIGASIAVRDRGQFAVGLDNLTDFVRAHRTGLLPIVAVPVHQGRTGQLWTVEITREDGAVVATGRVRLQNVDLPPDSR